MKMEQIFPFMIIILDLFASCFCLAGGDVKKAIYWLAAVSEGL